MPKESANGHILILWDESHIWGVLAIWAVSAMGLPYRLINSKKIAQGALFRKSRSDLLLVPGGSARLKSQSLGFSGRKKIRQWLHNGGNYLGFCGGAGLALADEGNLALCPWLRQKFLNRSSHFLSGAILARLASGELMRLPVWWPGRFAETAQGNVEVLCRYESPLPQPGARPFNQECALPDSFPAGQPIAIFGKRGAGKYLLSYAHLETPGWIEANNWLAALLQEKFGFSAQANSVPLLNIFTQPSPEDISICSEDLLKGWKLLNETFVYGEKLNFFYKRESWLPGWKTGVPGFPCASLLAMIHYLAQWQFSKRAIAEWADMRHAFLQTLAEFCSGAKAWLDHFYNFSISPCPTDLDEQKIKLFGHPIQGGGMAGKLLKTLDSLIFSSLV